MIAAAAASETEKKFARQIDTATHLLSPSCKRQVALDEPSLPSNQDQRLAVSHFGHARCAQSTSCGLRVGLLEKSLSFPGSHYQVLTHMMHEGEKMQRENPFKSLYELTAQLRAWEKAGHPPKILKSMKDDLFISQFGYTYEELISPLTPTQIQEIKEFFYEDAIECAASQGYDISCPVEKDGVMLERANDDIFVEVEDEVGDEEPFLAVRYDYDPEIHGPIVFEGCVIAPWFDWICMMVAKEEGLFPSTYEQIQTVKLGRSAKKFAEAAERNRHRVKDTGDEVTSVFGAARTFKPGTIVSTANRHGTKPNREVTVEIRGKRGR